MAFARRRSHVLSDAFAVALLLLSQTTWASAQERTSFDSAPQAEAAFSCEGRISALACPDPHRETPDVLTQDSEPVRPEDGSVRWGGVIKQTLFFQGIQHSFFMTQQKSRAGLKGPWVHDWFESASSPFVDPHWSDGGPFLVNYIGHPMGGSTYAYIYRQNDPSARGIEFGQKGYAAHLAKSMGIAALWSAQWEIGPFGEASLENVGKPPDRYKMAWQDFVITPTVGVAWMAGEDALDRFVVQKLERQIDSAAGRAAIRILFNPTRSMANLVAGQKPWKREGRP